MKTRVFLCEDHGVVREGLRALLSRELDIEVVGEAERGEEALERVGPLGAQVMVLDLTLPGLDGLEVVRRARKDHPACRLVVLSMHDDARTVERALAAGAHGYVVKGGGIDHVCEAIRSTLRSEIYVSPELAARGLGFLPSESSGLSPREEEVLHWIAEGMTSREVAQRLGLKPKTVENHRQRIMEKLGIHTTAGLVRYRWRGA